MSKPYWLDLAFTEGGQSVDAPGVLLLAIGGKRFRPLRCNPSVKDIPIPLVVHGWHTETAAIADPSHGDRYDRSGGSLSRELALPLLPFGRGGCDYVALAVETDDLGRPSEGAEHQHDSAVLAEVGDSLRAAARYIQVGDLAGPEYSKAVKALWRSVHVPILGERRRCNKEHVLLVNPAREFR